MDEAFMRGKRAFEAGLYRGQNPYSRGTREFVRWIQGWREAESEEIHAQNCSYR